MSDALCGPSNPLQQFTKQSSLNRTLQQDRLTSLHSPAQGFRSHDPHTGLLDSEFEAFQAGLPAPELQHFQSFPQSEQASFAGAQQQPSWATDFQRMQISLSPIHQQQQGKATWVQGFRENLAQQAPRAQQTASPTPLVFQQQARYGYQPRFQSQFAHQQPALQPNVQSAKGKEPVMEEYDDAAFAAAFDQAKNDVMVDERQASKMSQEEVEGYAQEVVDRIFSEHDARDLLQSEPTMQDETAVGVPAEQSQEQLKQREDDALAATALELLQKVQNNQTDKFKNSQFLGLMRKLADREVKVEGDKMVETETVGQTSSSTVVPSLTSAPATRTPLFDNTEQRPSPLASATKIPHAVDSRPPDYHIPYEQQDHDSGRNTFLQQPQDGQDVVDLLDEPTYDVGNDIGTSFENSDSVLPEGAPFYGDLRVGIAATGTGTEDVMRFFREPGLETRGDLAEMLYGHDGTLESGRLRRSG